MRRFASVNGLLSIAIPALIVLAACKGNSAGAVPPVAPLAFAQRGHAAFQLSDLKRKSKIRHIVIIVQENRSFNNLFLGYPGAKTRSWGFDSENKKISLIPISFTTKWDLQHNGQGFIVSCDGTGKIPGTDCRMNGFDKVKCVPIKGPCPKKIPDLAYAYVPHSETKPYFDMAHQYVLADQMYASDFDISSFESHQYIVAGVNPKESVDYPELQMNWGCTGGPADKIAVLLQDRKWLKDGVPIKSEPTCWKQNTLADELDAKRLSWAFYASPVAGGSKFACGRKGGIGADADDKKAGGGIWSAFQAIEQICHSSDWDDDVTPFSPPSEFLTDIKNGELRTVTWITPSCADSDHAGCNGDDKLPTTGPSWVTSLVNAIGESQFWDSTVIFIFWDDPGGWYDPVPPPYKNNDGLGYRLPLLIISPYAKKGYVDHTPYEHGSILKFVENTFGLPRLEPASDQKASDRRANAPIAAFDFMRPARAFVPIRAPLDAEHFMHEPIDTRPPDND